MFFNTSCFIITFIFFILLFGYFLNSFSKLFYSLFFCYCLRIYFHLLNYSSIKHFQAAVIHTSFSLFSFILLIFFIFPFYFLRFVFSWIHLFINHNTFILSKYCTFLVTKSLFFLFQFSPFFYTYIFLIYLIFLFLFNV